MLRSLFSAVYDCADNPGACRKQEHTPQHHIAVVARLGGFRARLVRGNGRGGRIGSIGRGRCRRGRGDVYKRQL